MSALGTAERRIKLMKLLCYRRYDTMANLAFEFSVSKRTIQRDIEEISEFIPIYVKTGKYQGGVYVVNGYYMERMYMSDREVLVLKKIRDNYINKEQCVLNGDDINTLEFLIKNYTRPSIK